jgi:hypothetical protein
MPAAVPPTESMNARRFIVCLPEIRRRAVPRLVKLSLTSAGKTIPSPVAGKRKMEHKFHCDSDRLNRSAFARPGLNRTCMTPA